MVSICGIVNEAWWAYDELEMRPAFWKIAIVGIVVVGWVLVAARN